MNRYALTSGLCLLMAGANGLTASAQQAGQDATAAESSKGYDRTIRIAEYLEPAIPHAEQEQAALDKL